MKKYLFTIFITILMIFCILFPEIMINSTKNALILWWKIVLPSLFPFMILSNLIAKTALPKLLGKILNPITQFLFNLPGVSSIAIFLGMIGGYPIGAKVTADLRERGIISNNDANSLIKFTNNSGPLFILGAVGIGLYNSHKIGILLLMTHYISALIVGFIMKPEKTKTNSKNNLEFEIINFSNLGAILNDAVKNAILSVSSICGFIILFSIISSILMNSEIIKLISKFISPSLGKSTSFSIISGLLEVTNGVNILAISSTTLKQKLVLTAILIGFGGISVHAQALSIISKTDIKASAYLTGKLLQGIVAGALTYLALLYTNFSEVLFTPAFAGIEYNSYEFNIIFSVITGIFVIVILFKIIQTMLYR